jgi:hypothetical protein
MKQEHSHIVDISSGSLHLIAMAFMLSDHMWASLFPDQDWMTCLGRLAFPIFAFMVVEGYFHTHDLRQYVKRLLLFAVISEIPFDLFYNGSFFYPFHQNVLWTFLLGILGIWVIERVRKQGNWILTILTAAIVVLLSWILGTITMVDYYGAGILTVLCFYFFRGRKPWCLAGQLIALYWINVGLLGGRTYLVTFLGREWELAQQGLALLSLIPIWLYRGRRGIKGKGFQYFCYGFYPVHMLILTILASVK